VYAYDGHGNIVSDGTRTFEYDQNNRLVRVSRDGTAVGEYFYDGQGRRVKKIASGIVTLYHYDYAGNLIAETDGTGTPLRDYVYLNGERIAMKVYGTQAGWYYFVNDHLGTPHRIVSESGEVVWAAAYLPFGGAQVVTEIVTNNFRFPGQYYDAETGLHYNWNRYYDPQTGRYLTPDPIGLEGGVNLYVYCLNAPVNLNDPVGLLTAMGGVGLRVTLPGIGAETGLFAAWGSEKNKYRRLALVYIETFVAGGVSAGKGVWGGLWSGDVSELSDATEIGLDLPLPVTSVSVLFDGKGNVGFTVGTPTYWGAGVFAKIRPLYKRLWEKILMDTERGDDGLIRSPSPCP